MPALIGGAKAAVLGKRGKIYKSNNTWSPTDKTSTLGLTDANLTVFQTGSSPRPTGKAVNQKQTGRVYFELLWINAPNSAAHFGIANTTYVQGNDPTGGTTGICLSGSGTVFGNGVSPSGFGAFGAAGAGDIYCVSVNFDLGLIWFRKNNGFWNLSSTANPDNFTGGYDISWLLGSAVAAVVDMVSSGSATVFFGANQFNFTPPANDDTW